MTKYLTKEDALKAVSSNGKEYETLPLKLRKDLLIAKTALQHGASFSYVPQQLANDPNFLSWIVKNKILELTFDQYLFIAIHDLTLINDIPGI